jgi:hypothetical protein
MAQILKFSNGGFSARVSRVSEFNEYRVRFYRADGSHCSGADYFTESRSDAIMTAQHEIARMNSQEFASV